MAFEVRNYITDCPAELIDRLNNGSPAVGPTCVQIIQGLTPGEILELTGESGGGSPPASVFEFTSALNAGEEAIFDSILATFDCTPVTESPVDDQDFSDDNGPDSNVIWSSEKITEDFVNIPGDTMTGSLTIASEGSPLTQSQLRIARNNDTGNFWSLGFNEATGAPEIGRSSTSGTMILMPDAGFPQWIFGSDAAGTSQTFIDCDNNGELRFNTLHTGAIVFGIGGAVPKTADSGTTPLGTSSRRWGPAFTSTLDVNGNIIVSGTVDGRDVATDGSVQDAHIADSDIHVDHTLVGITAGAGLTGGGDISTSRTINVGAGNGITVNANDVAVNESEIDHDSLQNFVANEHINHSSVSITGGGILSGGGDITANRTITLANSDVDHDQTTNFVANEHIDHTSVTLTAGAGLAGGGDISANRSFSVNVQNSIEISADTLQFVNDTASPGNTKLYGTNASGVKGWYDQPVAGGGASVQLKWQFDDSTSASNPGGGKFRVNNLTIASSTAIYVNQEDEEGVDATVLLNALEADDRIFIQQEDDASRFLLLNIVSVNDNGSWFTITYTVDDSGTNFDDGEKYGWVLLYVGGSVTTPGGDNKDVQFNNNGAFAGESNFEYDNVLKKVSIQGIDATTTLEVNSSGGSPDPSGGATFYIEVKTPGASIEGLRTYFNREAPGINGWITYDYDGNTPNLRLVDEDDDPPYISFRTIGTGTFDTPQFESAFGARGATANRTTGFSWYIGNVSNGGTEILSLDTDFLNLASGQYEMAGTAIPLKLYTFFADQVDYPRGSNWNVNNGAPASADSNNNALKVRRFDDSTDEAIGFLVTVPEQAQEMVVRTKARAETAPGGSQTAIMVLHKRSLPDNAAVSSWSTNALTNVVLPTNENFQYDTTSNTLAGWGLTAGVTYQMQLSRDANNGSDNLSGDLALLCIEIEFR